MQLKINYKVIQNTIPFPFLFKEHEYNPVINSILYTNLKNLYQNEIFTIDEIIDILSIIWIEFKKLKINYHVYIMVNYWLHLKWNL